VHIRAHHLLCIQGFQGYGYSQVFVDNMNEVIKNINSNPDFEIEITDECDVICSYCPYNIKNICLKEKNSSQRIKKIDLQILKKLGLERSARVKAKDILSFANMKLNNMLDIQDICGNCDWKEKCLWFISRNK